MGASRVKPYLFIFNVIFFFAGIALFGIGCFVSFSEFHTYILFLSKNGEARFVNASGYILIALGVIITIVYFLGCCGTCSESGPMLYTFSVVMGLLVIMEIVVAILFFVFKSHAKEIVGTAMDEGIDKYNMEGYEYYTNGWDKIQSTYACCGKNDNTDWKKNSFFDDTEKLAPESCCKTPGCDVTLENINTEGCFVRFDETFEGRINAIGITSIMIAVLQLGATIVACYFGKKAREGYNNWYSMLSIKRYGIC